MRFAIYSTDSIDPNVAADATFFDLDPLAGSYDPRFEWAARGAHVATLGGRIDQDYGFNVKDRKIRVAGEDMLEATRRSLEAKEAKIDTDWNFAVVGAIHESPLRVRFSRQPRGFLATLNALLFAQGERIADPAPAPNVRYSYEIILLVGEQLA